MKTCSRRGCSAPPTRQGVCATHYEAWRYRQHCYGAENWAKVSMYVDAEPTRQHVTALLAAGMGAGRIAELSGVDRTTIQCLLYPRESRRMPEPSKRVFRSNADKILAVPIPVGVEGLADGAYVLAVGSTRRLQALVAAGWVQIDLAERLGMQITNLTRLVTGRQKNVTAKKAREIAGLFAELQLTPGSSTRSVRLGERKGWALPLEWDEDAIDDPDARPVRSRRDAQSAREVRVLERRRQVDRLTAEGLSAPAIAERLGIGVRTVGRDRAAA